MKVLHRFGLKTVATAVGFCFVSWVYSHAAIAGVSFTLVADEESTKDMSVNFAAEDFLQDGSINPVAAVARGNMVDRDNTVNHDSGVLDVHFSDNKSFSPDSRSLIQFLTLEDQLAAHCWTKEETQELTATLRLYVIPPYGPRAHYRLLGQTPIWNPNVPPFDFNPVPASMPVAVFRQQTRWQEGNDLNSYFDVTHNGVPLDVQRVGVVPQPGITDWADLNADGSIKEFDESPAVDRCINRDPTITATNRDDGKIYELCYDDVPDADFEPWMEWDVTGAVRFWLENDFDPSSYHGFSLVHSPNDPVTRISDVLGKGRSRSVISFASSSAAADCAAAGGLWGGPDEREFAFINTRCMTSERDDLDPNFPGLSVPRSVAPAVRPEWRPQLVIPSRTDAFPVCVAGLPALSAMIGSSASGDFRWFNHLQSDRIQIESLEFSGPDAASFSVSRNCGAVDAQGGECAETITLRPDRQGEHNATLVGIYRVDGEQDPRSVSVEVSALASEDSDGIPATIENQAANNGDGNDDGVPDRGQSHVASFRNSDGNMVTIVTAVGTRLRDVRQADLSPSDEINHLDFNHGFYGFEVENVPPGGQISVELLLPDDSVESYYKYGSTPGNRENHWYQYNFDGNTGAEIDGNKVTLHFIDGARGDGDLLANGSITDPGGPAEDNSFDPITVKPTDARVGSFDPLTLALYGLALVVLALRRRRRVVG